MGIKRKSGSVKPRNDERKGVSLRKTAGKIISKLANKIARGDSPDANSRRRPFGGKGGRRKTPTDADIRKAESERRIAELEAEDASAAEGRQYSNVASVFNGFFYTDEKFIKRFEDREILTYIRAYYPEYDPNSNNETAIRKAILAMLSDSRFMSCLMETYGMTIFEVFEFLFRIEPSVFSGSFIAKV